MAKSLVEMAIMPDDDAVRGATRLVARLPRPIRFWLHFCRFWKSAKVRFIHKYFFDFSPIFMPFLCLHKLV